MKILNFYIDAIFQEEQKRSETSFSKLVQDEKQIGKRGWYLCFAGN
jgi:hypothetical protein